MYSVRLSYAWLYNTTLNFPISGDHWSWLWKLEVPKKMKFFLTDLDHCFRIYSLTSQTWYFLGFDRDVGFTTMPFHDWVPKGCKQDGASLFISAVWHIWKARNKKVFDYVSFTAYELVEAIQRLLKLPWTVFLHHTLWEGSQGGNWLAKHGSHSEQRLQV
ncbi:hypothetical protein RIF29_25762 [Crotalaria pallida]|uniref:Uncharacterized protein n=1 Tax=Crotalaria pallida TaxID=3830 RepID=A0AAN9ES00_CROPI